MDYVSLLAKVRQIAHNYFLSSWWLLPFLCSIIGFQCIKMLTKTTLVTTPSVLGMPIAQAVTELANQGLNVRILKEKEDNSVKPGMVINQNPHPNEKIKQQQSVFLVITKQAPRPKAPDIIALHESKGVPLAQSKGFKVKIFKIASNYPVGTILAQSPQVGLSNDTNELIVYVSDAMHAYRVMPSLLQQTPQTAEDLLKEYGIKVELEYTSADVFDTPTRAPRIVKQYPKAGQIVDLANLAKVIVTIS